MNNEIWHQKWQTNDISFHSSKPNPLLLKYLVELSLTKNSRVFLPLCGKTLDISWLLNNGYRVVGAELSKIAITQLFSELGLNPNVQNLGKLDHYSANNIDIYAGDLFDVSQKILGDVDAIYDRAALVALPANVRHSYANHLTSITDEAPQLMICYEYDQTQMDGPPYSVSVAEVNSHYKDHYDLTLISSADVVGGLKGKCVATENVWLLRRRRNNA